MKLKKTWPVLLLLFCMICNPDLSSRYGNLCEVLLSVHCTLYIVHCTLYIVQCTLPVCVSGSNCTLYVSWSTFYITCILILVYFMHYMCSIHCTMYITCIML